MAVWPQAGRRTVSHCNVSSTSSSSNAYYHCYCRSRWPCSLSRKSETAWFLGSRIRIPLRAGMFVRFVCCAGSSLCDELITCSDASYRVCVSNCMWSRNLGGLGPSWAVEQREKKITANYCCQVTFTIILSLITNAQSITNNNVILK